MVLVHIFSSYSQMIIENMLKKIPNEQVEDIKYRPVFNNSDDTQRIVFSVMVVIKNEYEKEYSQRQKEYKEKIKYKLKNKSEQDTNKKQD